MFFAVPPYRLLDLSQRAEFAQEHFSARLVAYQQPILRRLPHMLSINAVGVLGVQSARGRWALRPRREAHLSSRPAGVIGMLRRCQATIALLGGHMRRRLLMSFVLFAL